MSSMKIGTKMVVALGMIAAVLTLVGGIFIYEQEQARLLTLLESQGKVIQAQVEVTRAYIAKNYVGKVKTSSVGSNDQGFTRTWDGSTGHSISGHRDSGNRKSAGRAGHISSAADQ